MSKPRKLGKLMLVQWLDSRSVDASWQHTDDIDHEVCTVKTVGWVLKRDDKQLVLVQSYADGGDQVMGVVAIPLDSIQIEMPVTHRDRSEVDS